MRKKIIVAALSLLILITFFVSQQTFALYIEDGGEWDNGLKWKKFVPSLNDYEEEFKYFKVTKSGSILGKNEIKGDIIHYVWTYPISNNNDLMGLILQTVYYVDTEPGEDDVSYCYNIDSGNHIEGWCLNKDNVTSGKYYELFSYGDSYPVGTYPIVEGDYIYCECSSQDEFFKKKNDLINNGNEPDNGQTGGQLTNNGYEYDKIKYDLPNFKLTEYKKNSQDYTFKWNNSEVVKKPYFDILNVETQIQGCFKMAFKKDNLFKPYELRPIELPFEPLREVPAKNCFLSFDYADIPYCPENDINYQAIFDRMVSLGIAQEDELYRYNSLHHNDTHNKVLNPNILLRYHYTDEEKGVEHYSKKYTYLVIHDDDIEVYEVSPDDVVTDDKGNTDINPDNKEEILENNQVDIVDKSDDVTSNPGLFAKIKSFFNDIGSFPKYFSRIFSILPDWCLVYVAFGISLIVGVGVIKALL